MGKLVKTPAVALIFLLVLVGCEFWGIGVDSPEDTYAYRVELELSETSSNVDAAEVTWLLPASADALTDESSNGDGEREWGPRELTLGAAASDRVSVFSGTTERDWSDLLRLEFTVEVDSDLGSGEYVLARLRFIDVRLEADYSYDVACLVFVESVPSTEVLNEICGTPAEDPIVQLLVETDPQSINYSVNLPVRR